jgi:phage repressor protein C with HTH and peptisase S24 domain
MPSTVVPTRLGEYAVLEIALPGRPPEAAGVLLYDPEERRVGVRLRRDWDRIAAAEDAELLALLEDDLVAKSREFPPEEFFGWLEETLSNTLRLSERRRALLGRLETTLQWLYNKHVSATVEPFRTHLPLYSCRAAAGRFGELMEVEAEGWIETPPGLHLDKDMFVARVVGRSMEPEIPDGSLCVFRANVAGSRQGRKLLIEDLGESEEGGQRYTVKIYRSVKRLREDGTWEHERIRLEPLNPEFEAFELAPEERRFRVIGEFVCVLQPDPDAPLAEPDRS